MIWCCYCTEGFPDEVSSCAENADKAACKWVMSVGLFVLLLGVWLMILGVLGILFQMSARACASQTPTSN